MWSLPRSDLHLGALTFSSMISLLAKAKYAATVVYYSAVYHVG